MSSASRSVRLMSAQAMLLMAPACLYIEAERVAARISTRIVKQTESLADVQSALRRRPISCAEGADRQEFLTREDVLQGVLVARRENDAMLAVCLSDVLAWAMKHGLPYSRGMDALRKASSALDGSLIQFSFDSGFCPRRHPLGPDSAGAEAEAREEEVASVEWLEQVLPVLDEHDGELAAARAAFESDRLGLFILSSVLWMSQVIGWGLTILVVLPGDFRAWRRRRAARSNPGSSLPGDG